MIKFIIGLVLGIIIGNELAHKSIIYNRPVDFNELDDIEYEDFSFSY